MKYSPSPITRSSAVDIFADPESLNKEEKALADAVLAGIDAEGKLLHLLADELERTCGLHEGNTTTVSLDIVDPLGRVNVISVEHHKEMAYGDEEHQDVITTTRIVDMSAVYDSLQARFRESEEELMDELEELEV